MTRLHGFEDNSGGPPSGCRPVAALITRLSSQTACSSAEGRTSSHALCELLNLSEEQRQYFTGVLPGQGLMKIGSAFVPFDGRIPSGGDLYRLYSTSFQEQEGK